MYLQKYSKDIEWWTARYRLELSTREEVVPNHFKVSSCGLKFLYSIGFLGLARLITVSVSQGHLPCSPHLLCLRLTAQPLLIHSYLLINALVFPLLPSPHSSCSTGSHINVKAATSDYSNWMLPFPQWRKKAFCSILSPEHPVTGWTVFFKKIWGSLMLQHFRMWACLEMRSLQMEPSIWNHTGVEWALHATWQVSLWEATERRRENTMMTEAETEVMLLYTNEYEGLVRMAKARRESHGIASPLVPPEKTNPVNTLILDF